MIAPARRGLVALVLVTICAFLVPASAQGESVTVTCDTPGQRDGCNRWYSADAVILDWDWDPAAITAVGCGGATFTSEGLVSRSCTVQWPGTSITKAVWIGIDRTAPELVGLQPDRPLSPSGWFTGPVGLTFQGRDEVSGVASCSSTSYSGPDGAGIPVGGSCVDVAGNVGAGSLPINYDATPPRRPKVRAAPRNRRVTLSWRPTAGAEAVVERRTGSGAAQVVYRGPGRRFVDKRLRNGRRYRYVVTLLDQAGNRAVGKASAVPTALPLLSPANGAKLRRPPTLVWKAHKRASYYNVQLIRRRKILSRWPRTARLRLTRSWTFAGRRFRLVPGRYCWRVWPGIGARSKGDYGRMLGTSCFTIVGS